MQDFMSRFTPSVWTALKNFYPLGNWDGVTEVAGHLTGGKVTSRGQADLQADLLTWSDGSAPVDPTTKTNANAGVLAPIPSSVIKEPRDTWAPIFHPPANFIELLPILNANGEWVAPTTASITKAAAAGLDNPLYAFDHKVAGAYPFTWIDHLYAPAHGLSIEKTEGLATLIRYMATGGQDVAASVGEGRLPDALVQQSLQAADSLVLSNCVGADRRVVSSSDPGPYGSKIPALASIGTMLHCEPTGVPESTTTVPTTTPTTFNPALNPNGFPDSGINGGSSSLDTGTGIATTGPGAATATANGTGTGHNGHTGGTGGTGTADANKAELATATHLPIQSSGTTGVDKLGAFLLGVVLYLLLRKPVAQLARRATG
jgi:hypothetical protein